MAQAGNVAVPGAAREHFVPSASTASTSVSSCSVLSPRALSAVEGASERGSSPRRVKCPILGKGGKPPSRLKKKVSTSAFDYEGDDGNGDDIRDDGVEGGGVALAPLRDFAGGTDVTTPFRSKRFDAGADSHGHGPDATFEVTEEGGVSSGNHRLHSRRLSPRDRGGGGGGGSGGGGGGGYRNRQGNPSAKWSSEVADD